jgi:hypothetical protein
MAIKYINLFQSKVLQNWDFLYENKPSGNPGAVFPDSAAGTSNPIFWGRGKKTRLTSSVAR